MNTKGSIDIECPIEHVFRCTNQDVTQWSTIVKEERILNKVDDGPGTTFVSVTEERGQRMEFQGVVTHWDPPHTSSIELSGEHFSIKVVYQFESIENGTRVTQDSYVRPEHWLMKIMFSTMGWLMKSGSCKALQEELESLKQYCLACADRA